MFDIGVVVLVGCGGCHCTVFFLHFDSTRQICLTAGCLSSWWGLSSARQIIHVITYIETSTDSRDDTAHHMESEHGAWLFAIECHCPERNLPADVTWVCWATQSDTCTRSGDVHRCVQEYTFAHGLSVDRRFAHGLTFDVSVGVYFAPEQRRSPASHVFPQDLSKGKICFRLNPPLVF